MSENFTPKRGDDWFDRHTVKRNMSELTKLGDQFDKVVKEAKKNLDQRMNGLYEDMGNILSRYYKIGEITEDEMKQRLGITESKGDCGCGCGGTTPGGCGDKSVNEESVKVSSRNTDGSITTTIKEESDLNEQEQVLYEFGRKVERMIMTEKVVRMILVSGGHQKLFILKENLMFTRLHLMDGL